MTIPRIQKFVSSCGTCPHCQYNSGGQYLCSLTDQPVQTEGPVPSFCPLPIFPAKELAGLEATVRAMQGSIKHGFGSTLLAYIAARINQPLHATGLSLTVPYVDRAGREEKTVTLRWDCIIEVIVNRGFSVEFMADGRKYILHPDLDTPQIKVQAVNLPPGMEGEELFTHHDVVLNTKS